MNTPLRYDVVVGTGGIGSGMFLALEGNKTLGREESRWASLVDQRDDCKLHNILHYVQKLLGHQFRVIPVGRVGDDGPGRTVLMQMSETGFEMDHVKITPGVPTLFSVCFQYTDGDGGNLTLKDSASAMVDAVDVSAVEPVLREFAGRGIVVAAPEVPLAARARLLELGTRHGFLRVAAFVSSELTAALEDGMLASVDLLALNIDEAASVAGMTRNEESKPQEVARLAVDRLCAANPAQQVVITAGADGSWAWDGQDLIHTPALPFDVVNTAGAGDAHLGGLIVALVAGSNLNEANRFATLISAQKVMSRDTIAREISLSSTVRAAESHGVQLGSVLMNNLRVLA
jgi:ribokinase